MQHVLQFIPTLTTRAKGDQLTVTSFPLRGALTTQVYSVNFCFAAYVNTVSKKYEEVRTLRAD